MLSDSTSFKFRHLSFADGIQKGGLAVIDMAHDGHNWSSGNMVFDVVLFLFRKIQIRFFNKKFNLEPKFIGDLAGKIKV